MPEPIILGVDPGLSGAVAAVTRDGCALWACPLPCVVHPPRRKGGRSLRLLDAAALARTLTLERGRVALAVVEEVHSMPRQGVASTFSFGRGLGAIEGILATLHVPVRLVSPQRWKAEVLGPRLRPESWSKGAAVAYAQRRFPGIALVPPRGRVPHDGLAEALLIAEFGRRLLAGESEGGAA